MCTDMRLQAQTGTDTLQAQSKPPALPVVVILSANAITAIVWAKKLVPQELDRIMRRNENVLDIFDNVTNPIPKWYR